jgi:putative FmdB family regulatory protein
LTYEYKCDLCGARLEIRATVAEKERGLQVECPACGSTQTTQVFSAVNVLTQSGRGGGFPPGCGPGSGAGCCG